MLVNGEPILSCLTLAVAVDGADILTIEGVAAPRHQKDVRQQDRNVDRVQVAASGIAPAAALAVPIGIEPGEDRIGDLAGGRYRDGRLHRSARAILAVAV